jgi:hypothetical protein
MGICMDITLHKLYEHTFRLVTLPKFIAAPIQASDTFVIAIASSYNRTQI